MIGRVTAVEFTVRLAEMMAWLRETGFELDDRDLSDLTHMVDEDWDEDASIDWDTQRHEVTIRQSGTRTGRFDLAMIEDRYRLYYLQNLDTDEVEMPGLCSFEKHQTLMDSEFKFTYTLDPSRLVDRGMLERVQGALDSTTERLAEARQTMADSAQDYNNRLVTLQQERDDHRQNYENAQANGNKYAEAINRIRAIVDGEEATEFNGSLAGILSVLDETLVA